MQKRYARPGQPGRSSALATRALCGKRTNQQSATKALAQHHEMQLRERGTNMGSDGHQVLDLRHIKDLLWLHTGEF